jgi:hypothetical protein
LDIEKIRERGGNFALFVYKIMPSLNVLFWNVGKKDLTPQLVNLSQSKDVDIFILAENPVSSVRLIQALNEPESYFFSNHPLSQCDKITIVTRFHYGLIEPIEESRRMTTRLVHLITGENFLLTALHLVDKSNFSPESQNEAASLVAADLLRIEERHNSDRHVVIGDFNMNPFETGMIKANGFHGTMSSEIATKGSRTVQARDYPYFYNPTWGLLGDLSEAVPGTYYYQHAEHICFQWNVFDQVLIRPSMLGNFVKSSLAIVQHDGINSLLTLRNLPNKTDYSDHLPLFFSLQF